MPNTGVGYIRNEASALLDLWWMIRDAIEGEPAIKGQYGVRATYFLTNTRARNQSEKYLPRPNPLDKSLENDERYKSYVKRAVWYNFTSRTLAGLIGQIFLRPPVTNLPSQLDPLTKNADGEGLTLEQVAKRTARSVMSYGRAGLLTDYPVTAGPQTIEQMKTNNIQPTIKHYHPWQVINWATVQRGAKQVLSMVVLEEVNMVEVDQFELAETTQYRVLKLDPASWTYSVEIWRADTQGGAAGNNYSAKESFTPTDLNGKPFDEIPFTFVGAEANDVWPDIPPMYDLASLNVAHYRNSADYEEACYIVGQPTPVIIGVTEQWVENVLKGAVQLGSRSSISLPPGADAKLLQAAPNQMPLEAMKLKEEQALALGAKLVQSSKKVRTATEVMVDTTSESSTLHNVSKNTSAAIEQNLAWAARFAGGSETSIKYQLNTEFELTRMNANDRLAIVKMWQCGAIAFTEMRDVLRVDGTASLDDKTATEQISKEQAAASILGGAPIADPLQAVAPLAPGNVPTPGTPPKPAVKAPKKKAAAAA